MYVKLLSYFIMSYFVLFYLILSRFILFYFEVSLILFEVIFFTRFPFL